jgi:chromosome segregation ATPase
LTLTAPNRLTNAHLAEIGQRLATPLTDEGYRAWYRADVNALAEEVLFLRRDRAAAMQEFATHPPLEGIDQNTDLANVAAQLSELWVQQQQGVWQRAEVKRIREKLADTEQRLQAATRTAAERADAIVVLEQRIAALQAQVAEIDAGRHQARAETTQAVADHAQREAALQAQIAQAQADLRTTVEDARKAIAEVHAVYTERGLRVTALLTEAAGILGE